MNKRKREAWRKHRLSEKKTEAKRKAAAVAPAGATRK